MKTRFVSTVSAILQTTFKLSYMALWLRIDKQSEERKCVNVTVTNR